MATIDDGGWTAIKCTNAIFDEDQAAVRVVAGWVAWLVAALFAAAVALRRRDR